MSIFILVSTSLEAVGVVCVSHIKAYIALLQSAEYT